MLRLRMLPRLLMLCMRFCLEAISDGGGARGGAAEERRGALPLAMATIGAPSSSASYSAISPSSLLPP